jgi:hypothetical protein
MNKYQRIPGDGYALIERDGTLYLPSEEDKLGLEMAHGQPTPIGREDGWQSWISASISEEGHRAGVWPAARGTGVSPKRRERAGGRPNAGRAVDAALNQT